MKVNKPRIVLDTNVFLVSLSNNHQYHWLYEYILEGKIELCLTTDILMEYEEIVSERYKIDKLEGMFNFLLLLPNVFFVNPTYRWYLIDNDHDDDKFVDCYITANADFLVGNDRHFNILNTIDFPKINLLKYEVFEDLFRGKI